MIRDVFEYGRKGEEDENTKSLSWNDETGNYGNNAITNSGIYITSRSWNEEGKQSIAKLAQNTLKQSHSSEEESPTIVRRSWSSPSLSTSEQPKLYRKGSMSPKSSKPFTHSYFPYDITSMVIGNAWERKALEMLESEFAKTPLLKINVIVKTFMNQSVNTTTIPERIDEALKQKEYKFLEPFKETKDPKAILQKSKKLNKSDEYPIFLEVIGGNEGITLLEKCLKSQKKWERYLKELRKVNEDCEVIKSLTLRFSPTTKYSKLSSTTIRDTFRSFIGRSAEASEPSFVLDETDLKIPVFDSSLSDLKRPMIFLYWLAATLNEKITNKSFKENNERIDIEYLHSDEIENNTLYTLINHQSLLSDQGQLNFQNIIIEYFTDHVLIDFKVDAKSKNFGIREPENFLNKIKKEGFPAMLEIYVPCKISFSKLKNEEIIDHILPKKRKSNSSYWDELRNKIKEHLENKKIVEYSTAISELNTLISNAELNKLISDSLPNLNRQINISFLKGYMRKDLLEPTSKLANWAKDIVKKIDSYCLTELQKSQIPSFPIIQSISMNAYSVITFYLIKNIPLLFDNSTENSFEICDTRVRIKYFSKDTTKYKIKINSQKQTFQATQIRIHRIYDKNNADLEFGHIEFHWELAGKIGQDSIMPVLYIKDIVFEKNVSLEMRRTITGILIDALIARPEKKSFSIFGHIASHKD